MFQGRFLLFYLFVFVLVFSGPGCKKDEEPSSQDQIPVVPVSISLNPNSTEFIRLNVVTGWEEITGGYRGIIVYRNSVDEFTVFERACPYDWNKTTTRVEVDTSGMTISCPICKSKFIILNGAPYQGPSRFSLKQYETSYNGNLLYIFN
jgi:nitrite reductase/ring-hydroxylating ferredoxin subunit